MLFSWWKLVLAQNIFISTEGFQFFSEAETLTSLNFELKNQLEENNLLQTDFLRIFYCVSLIY